MFQPMEHISRQSSPCTAYILLEIGEWRDAEGAGVSFVLNADMYLILFNVSLSPFLVNYKDKSYIYTHLF